MQKLSHYKVGDSCPKAFDESPFIPLFRDESLQRMDALLRRSAGITVEDMAAILDIAEDRCRTHLKQLLARGGQIRAFRHTEGEAFHFKLEGYGPSILYG
jgi:hypothetical protein